MNELLPCPFCGESDAERGYNEARWPIIKCMNCGAQGPCISSDEAKAEENWNRRAPIKSLEAAQDAAAQDEITQRITEYLAHGGLFNPELMDHEKVRDLLIGCRAKLAFYRAGQGYCYITNAEYERLKGDAERLSMILGNLLDQWDLIPNDLLTDPSLDGVRKAISEIRTYVGEK